MREPTHSSSMKLRLSMRAIAIVLMNAVTVAGALPPDASLNWPSTHSGDVERTYTRMLLSSGAVCARVHRYRHRTANQQ